MIRLFKVCIVHAEFSYKVYTSSSLDIIMTYIVRALAFLAFATLKLEKL